MARERPANVEIVDQFAIWERNGILKKSGLVQGDFTVTIYQDGAIKGGHPFTITEIGSTGEYKLAFTPDAVGFWVAEVAYSALRQDWTGEYDVQVATIDDLRALMLIGNALEHDNAVVDQQQYNHTYQGRKYLTDARIRAYNSKVNAEAAGTTGLIHQFTLHAEYTDDEQTLFRIVRVL